MWGNPVVETNYIWVREEKKKKPLALGKEHEYKLGAALNMKVQENLYRPYSKTQNQRTSLKLK